MAKYKVWAISLLYNDAEIMLESLNQYRKTSSSQVETQHVLVWQHWPVDKANVRLKMKAWAEEHGAIFLDPGRNLGLHGGFNYALANVPIPGNALVVGYDPDCYPDVYGWDLAMCDIFMADSSVVWQSLWHQHAHRELNLEGRAEAPTLIGGIWVQKLKSPALNSVCGFRRDWLEKVGGLYEGNHYYGGLECSMWEKIKPGKWVFLRDFFESPRFHDIVNPKYREWKWRYAHVRDIKVDFETWLNSSSLT